MRRYPAKFKIGFGDLMCRDHIDWAYLDAQRAIATLALTGTVLTAGVRKQIESRLDSRFPGQAKRWSQGWPAEWPPASKRGKHG